jgi:HD-GYP domain-containing protein (c-di-GMP phosphodiesterase class II)
MRVLAVADVYEALTADRPYRKALSETDALDLIRLDVPHRFDGEAFEALEAVLERPARR